MKRNLLVLCTLILSVGQIWSQTDITGGNNISAFATNQTFTGNAYVKNDFNEAVFNSNGFILMNEGADYTAVLLLSGGGALPSEGAVAAGDYIVRITGLAPNYTGIYDLEVAIAPEDISTATIDPLASKVFTGSPILISQSDITGSINSGGYTLKSTDFTIASHSGNTNVGTASVTLNGTGNFTGTKTVNFTISPANIANATFAAITNKTFTGSSINLLPADISGTLGSYTLQTSDYSITSYSANTDAGQATATLNGAGNFTGTTTVNFTISPADIAGATFATIANKKFTGTAITLQPSEISGTFSTYTLQTSDYSVGSYSANTDAGSATVTLNGAGNFNGTKTVNFTIVPASLDTDVTVSVSDQSNTGEVIKPKPIVKLGDVTLQEGTHYSLSYPDTDPNAYIGEGTWNIRITAMGTNLTGGPKNVTFEIAATNTNPPLPIITFGELGENIHAGDIGNHEDGTVYLTFTAPVGTKPEDLYARSGGVSYTIIPMGNGNFHIDVKDVIEGMKVDIGWADPSGNEKLTDYNAKVYTRDGNLFVETTESSSLAVYMITGRQYTVRTIQQGTTTIQLPKGIYIVKVGDKGYKVVVR